MSKKVTIFGAGLVVKPMVDYLAGKGYEITVASRTLSKAEKLAAPHSNVEARQFLSDDEAAMSEFVKNSDLVVSLLPATLHVKVAEKCIKYNTDMLTTSYISPQMRALDEKAKDAGIIILNEIGVDPGIDHMSAMRIFHKVEEEGGKIVSFMSYCGGLPAQEANTNPLGYKFSWAPKGVLKAAGNGAKFMFDGKIRDIEGKDLFKNYWFVDVEGAGTLEAYPNRNSLDYIDLYDLKDVKTMYRGTFRNISHCDTWYIMSQMGFYKEDEIFENLEGTVKDFILTKMFKVNKNKCLKMFLYLCFYPTDRQTTNMILKQGLTIWFNGKVKKQKNFGIRFSLERSDTGKFNVAEHNPEMMTGLNEYLPQQLEIIGQEEGQIRKTTVSELVGIEIQSGMKKGLFTYELKIPYVLNLYDNYSIEAKPGDEIAVGFEIEKGDPDFSKYSKSGKFSGDHTGEGTSGKRQGGGEIKRPSGENGSIGSSIEFWVNIQLATE